MDKKLLFLMLLSLSFSSIFADTYTHYDWTCLTKNNSPVSVNESVNNTQNYGSAKYYSNGGNGLPSNCVGKQTKQNYTMTIDNNGGSGGALKYNNDGSMYISNPSRTGYTFTSWNTSNGNAPASKIPASFAGNVTYTANWKINQYTISVNGDGGVSGIDGNGTYDYGSQACLTYRLKTGYKLSKIAGTGPDAGQTWTDKAGRTGNIVDCWSMYGDRAGTVYTEAIKYNVSYNNNGGNGSMSASTATYGQAFITKKNAFSRTGYTFNGWNESANGSGVAWGLGSNGVYESGKSWTWNYTKDITLYAQWKQELPTSFNLEAASGRLYNGPISVDLKKNQLYVGMFLGNKRPEGEEPQLSTNVNSGNSTILFSDYGSMNDNRRQTYIVFIPKSDFRASFKSSTDTQQSTFVLLKGNSEVPYSSYNSSDFSFGVSHNNSELSQVQNDKWGYGFVNISWYDTGAPWFDVQYSGSSFIDKSSSGDAGATVRVIGYNLQNKGIKIRGSASSSQYPVQNYGSLIIKKK